MWTRKELKEKAKIALKRNYWMAVVAGLLFMLLSGSLGISSSFSFGGTGSTSDYNNDIYYEEDGTISGGYISEDIDNIFSQPRIVAAIVVFVIIFIIAFIIAFAVGMAVSVFLGNPLLVGVQKFFNRSLYEKSELNHVVSGFTKNYKNTVKVMFFKDLYVLLWSLLFLIPGIIKSYEYLMVPYILGDNPDISKNEALELSRQMMMGQKWNAFVLNLSFIGWNLLSLFTCGILQVFYVTPYIQYTNAALYRRLSGKDEEIEVQA